MSDDTLNIEYKIDALRTPEQLCDLLEYAFTEDQAYKIAADIYQPLVVLIKELNQKIIELDRR